MWNKVITKKLHTGNLHKTNSNGMDILVGHVYNTLTRLYKKVFF